MPRCAFARAICRTMPPLESLPGTSNHLKACWADVTDPNEQAYAEKRRQARIEKMLATTNAQSGSSISVAEDK